MRLSNHKTPPANVLPSRHQPVHEVITAGNTGKHPLHIPGAVFSGQVGHDDGEIGN
jgi:hypothetical protein